MKTVFITLVGFMLSMSASSDAEVFRGVGPMYHWTWDFSDSVSVPYPDSSQVVDLIMLITMQQQGIPSVPATFYVGANYGEGALITAVPDTSFQDLMFAPEDVGQYTYYIPAIKGLTYVARTVEGHYAKFHFLLIFEQSYPTIEYVYQPDGSRRLYDYIGVESCTWGRIKLIMNSLEED